MSAVHKDSVETWKDFSNDIKVVWVRMTRNVPATTLSPLGNSSIKEAGYLRPGGNRTKTNWQMNRIALLKDS